MKDDNKINCVGTLGLEKQNSNRESYVQPKKVSKTQHFLTSTHKSGWSKEIHSYPGSKVRYAEAGSAWLHTGKEDGAGALPEERSQWKFPFALWPQTPLSHQEALGSRAAPIWEMCPPSQKDWKAWQ